MMIRATVIRSGIIAALLLSSIAPALADHGGMNDEQMQLMMENAKKMQECMDRIDPAVFDQLEKQGREMETEIKALCAAGKHDEAEKKAMAYGKEMSNTEGMKELQKCGQMGKGMMEHMPVIREKLEEGKAGHICDSM